ncbi:MAG: 50S ribosomal protein L22 [Candidatus Moranbacteria bacterium]|nr:50S ribosomal protein L22 [Candidatus Moranbacteria bacterium]
MQVRARLKNFRMSYKKARMYTGLIKGKSTQDAKNELKYINSKLSLPLIKLIDSSVANGVNNFGLSKKNLYVEEIKVDEGRVMKRWRPRAQGRAYPILKRSCHIEIILNEIEEGKDRIKIEQKEAQTVSYKELKKAMEEADRMVKNKNKGKDSGKKAQDSKSKGKGKISNKKVMSRFFRRKSI